MYSCIRGRTNAVMSLDVRGMFETKGALDASAVVPFMNRVFSGPRTAVAVGCQESKTKAGRNKCCFRLICKNMKPSGKIRVNIHDFILKDLPDTETPASMYLRMGLRTLSNGIMALWARVLRINKAPDQHSPCSMSSESRKTTENPKKQDHEVGERAGQ